MGSIQALAIECCPKLLECLAPPEFPVRVLVVAVPAHCRDAGPHQDAELLDEMVICPGVKLGDLFGAWPPRCGPGESTDLERGKVRSADGRACSPTGSGSVPCSAP